MLTGVAKYLVNQLAFANIGGYGQVELLAHLAQAGFVELANVGAGVFGDGLVYADALEAATKTVELNDNALDAVYDE